MRRTMRVSELLILVLVVGCGPTGFSRVDYPDMSRALYEIGEEYEVTAGSRMSVVETGPPIPVWKAIRSYQPPPPRELETVPAIHAGEEWLAFAESDGGDESIIYSKSHEYEDDALALRIELS